MRQIKIWQPKQSVSFSVNQLLWALPGPVPLLSLSLSPSLALPLLCRHMMSIPLLMMFILLSPLQNTGDVERGRPAVCLWLQTSGSGSKDSVFPACVHVCVCVCALHCDGCVFTQIQMRVCLCVFVPTCAPLFVCTRERVCVCNHIFTNFCTKIYGGGAVIFFLLRVCDTVDLFIFLLVYFFLSIFFLFLFF